MILPKLFVLFCVDGYLSRFHYSTGGKKEMAQCLLVDVFPLRTV